MSAHLERSLTPRTATSAGPAPAAPSPQQWARSSRESVAPPKNLTRQEAKREAARHEFRKGLVGLVLLAVIGLTLPTTLPIAQEHVLTPLAQYLGATLQESVQQPPPPPP